MLSCCLKRRKKKESKNPKFARTNKQKNSSIKQVNTRYKLNKTENTFLLAGDKSIPYMHLRQAAFAYRASGPFKKKQRSLKYRSLKKQEIHDIFIKTN